MISKGSFEDFLYIIIGLIWIGFSIYKAQQKKKAITQGGGDIKKEKSFFDNLMSEFVNEEPSKPYQVPASETPPLETTEKRKNMAEKKFSYDDLYEESNVKSYFDVYENKPAMKAEFAEEFKSSQQQKKRKPKIDLRKAVIYSEILNRKYT
jgi:hypothetical protein